MIITFYNEKLNTEVVRLQKEVFKSFGLSINQIQPKTWITHGRSIDDFILNLETWEYLILFDTDAIPLNKTIIDDVINWVKNNDGLIGIRQHASHIPNSIDYIGPAFMAFNKKTFEILNKPTFQATNRSDCAGELTYLAKEKNLKIKFLNTSDVMIPKWSFEDKTEFGIGTTYENSIFHAFESRFNGEVFINKCKSLLQKK